MQLQDLDQLIRASADQKTSAYEKRLGFALDGVDLLKKHRENVASRIKPDLLSHYEKLVQRYPQPIVPTKDNICLGCFIRQPTGQVPGQQDIHLCESCKRILYELKI